MCNKVCLSREETHVLFFFSQLELEVSKVDRELQVEYFLMVGRQPDFDALQQPSTSSTPKRLVSVEKVCTSSG